MKKYLIILYVVVTALLGSCSDDLGNYNYTTPEAPVVSNLDTIYKVSVGDKLTITPKVSFSNNDDLSYEWKITIPAEMREIYAEGPELNLYFTLKAERYEARFAVVDNRTGMKYFYYFVISGQASFSEGITLLTSNAGKTEISFIRTDGSILPNIYEHMYGESLSQGPLQLVPLQHMFMNNFPYLGYWIICSDKKNPGVQLDVNTFQRIKYFRENFFNENDEDLNVQYLYPTSVGVMAGIINSKLYLGASSTYYISPIYGYFGVPVLGDYILAPYLIHTDSYFIGYDPQQKALIYFDGGGSYFGVDYSITGNAFDPKSLNIDIICMEMVNADSHYILARDKADQQIYELKFGIKTSPRALTPLYKKLFPGNSLLTVNTKWVLSNTEIFYFSSNDKVYRYNPLNEEIKVLDTNFEGKAVTCLKLGPDGKSLIAGTEGNLYFLDISTGKYGSLLKHYDGFTGSPVDVYVRK